MAFKSNTRLAEVGAGARRGVTARRATADVIPFPTPRRRARPLPKLELLTALFGAIGLVGGPASSEVLVAIVSGALPDRPEGSVREDVEALLQFYSSEKAPGQGVLRIFDQLADGRYVLSEGVRGFLA